MCDEGANRWRFSGMGGLLLSALLLFAAWVVMLPWLAARPTINAHLRWLDERRIDPRRNVLYGTRSDGTHPGPAQQTPASRRVKPDVPSCLTVPKSCSAEKLVSSSWMATEDAIRLE